MFGRVLFQKQGRVLTADLGDNGLWHCRGLSCLERPLNILYSPDRFGGSGDVHRLRRCVEEAARWLGGTASWNPGAEGQPRSGTRPGRAAPIGG